ncbi:MAG: LysR substrate-binding domain-containing protein [Pseudomonadota bacterium]
MRTNLSIRQLQTFAEVMRSGSISAAARSLGRTQPAVSSTIASLEQEIGFSLFERERKRLVAKPEAHYFLEEAEVVLTRLTKASRTIREVADLQKGRLRIACSPAASTYFMPHALAEFLVDKPKVQISLMMRSSSVVTDWIASQQYDVGFGESSQERSTINAQRFSFPCLCAIPKKGKLASKSVIVPTDLAAVPLAIVHQQNVLGPKTRKVFKDADVRLNHRFEFESILPALQLVSEGLCYLICDSFSALSHQNQFKKTSGIVFRPFKPMIYLDMSLMSPANRPKSQLAEAFLASLNKKLKAYAEYRG